MTSRLVPQIEKATHEIAIYLEKYRPALAVSQAEAHILSHLHGSGPCPIGELHRSFGHKRSTLTSILDRLERRRLISREVNPHDRRSFVIRLTREGKVLAGRVHRAVADLEARVARDLSPAELRTCERVLVHIGSIAAEPAAYFC